MIQTCPHCSSKANIPDEHLGKKVRCKKCQGVYLVIEDEQEQEWQPPVSKPAPQENIVPQPTEKLEQPPMAQATSPVWIVNPCVATYHPYTVMVDIKHPIRLGFEIALGMFLFSLLLIPLYVVFFAFLAIIGGR